MFVLATFFVDALWVVTSATPAFSAVPGFSLDAGSFGSTFLIRRVAYRIRGRSWGQ